MIAIPSMSGRHVAVLGLGRSGMAAARALVHSGAHVLAWDDDEECRGRAGAEIKLSAKVHVSHFYSKSDFFIKIMTFVESAYF